MTEYINFKWPRDEDGVYHLYCERGFQRYERDRKRGYGPTVTGLNISKVRGKLFPWLLKFEYLGCVIPLAEFLSLKDAKKFAVRHFMSEEYKKYGLEWRADLDLIAQQEGIEFQRPTEQAS